MTLDLSEEFCGTIRGVYGEAGDRWLGQLSALLDEAGERWSLTMLPPFPNLSYNYVAPVVRADGTNAVLKAGVPEEPWPERDALRLYDGRNCVRLLDSDAERGFLLLERLEPGMTLVALASEERDQEATAIAADVMRDLWRPAPPEHAFPTVAGWMAGLGRLRTHFGGGVGPLPAALVEEAEALTIDLLASAGPPVLLHGDLHHDNILAARRRPWLAIDPKGVVGEPAYEVGALLRNRWPDRHSIANPGRLFARRVRQLAEELELDPARVRGWGVAQAVLSAWWCIEDNGDCFEAALADARLIAAVKA